jgi:MFS family permease
VPLYLSEDNRSASVAGLVLLVVPATMVVLGPFVGRYLDRIGARRVLRTGLVLLAAGQLGLLLATRAQVSLGLLAAVLIVAGIGIAGVQTPAATGATRSPAGAQGTGLGLYNLIRFSGSAMGAAWVAIAVGVSGYPLVFAVAAVVVALGFLGSFFGPDPRSV